MKPGAVVLHHDEPFRHLPVGGSQLTRDGVWLIALGGILVAAGVLIGGHLAGLSTRPLGAAGRRSDRLAFALTAVGALLVAAGGAVAGVQETPDGWVIVVTCVAFTVAFYVVAAWRLRVDMDRGRKMARNHLEDPRLGAQADRLRWDERYYHHRRRWVHCFSYAFKSDTAGDAAARADLGEPPDRFAGPSEDTPLTRSEPS